MFRTWSKAIIPLSKFRTPMHQTYARVAAAPPPPIIEEQIEPMVCN